MSNRSVLGLGTTALAVLLPNTKQVVKSPHPELSARARSEVEVKVYERFAGSRHIRLPSILQYYGRSEDGITLEYAENFTLREFLRKPTSWRTGYPPIGLASGTIIGFQSC